MQDLEQLMNVKIELKEQAKQVAERKVVEMRQELDQQIQDNVMKKMSVIEG